MKIRTVIAAAAISMTLLTVTGCAVGRGQQTAGAYVDDSAITASVKTRMLDNPNVAGTSITVETLNGTVMLSGFAKSQKERIHRRKHRPECRRRESRQERDHRPPVSPRLRSVTPPTTAERRNT